MLLIFCGLILPTQAEEARPQLIRLHVVAGSDAPDAQALKLELRDVCLRCAEVCIGDAPDSDAAFVRLNAHLDDFQRACENRARELGFEGEIAVETGVFPFPDRIYGSVRVPAGDYRALRVRIGAGEGHNWWCVLYPGLCALDEKDYAGEERPCYSAILNWIGEKIGGLR